MPINYTAILIATFIPLIIAFMWYNPKFGFGKAWMQATGITQEDEKKANKVLMFSLTFLFSFFVAFIMQTIVIHQFHIYNFLHEQKDFAEPNSLSSALLTQIMDAYAGSYRSFKHGVLHGTMAGIFLALPIISINALFEMKGAKYVAINAGYWMVSMALMGGVICAMM
jgi:hypothetical protein